MAIQKKGGQRPLFSFRVCNSSHLDKTHLTVEAFLAPLHKQNQQLKTPRNAKKRLALTCTSTNLTYHVKKCSQFIFQNSFWGRKLILRLTFFILLAMSNLYASVTLAQSQSAKASNSGIGFKLTAPVDDFDISGSWFPAGLDKGDNLVGRTQIVLKNQKTLKTIQIEVQSLSILNRDIQPYIDDSKITPAQIEEKIKTELGSDIEIKNDYRAKRQSCDTSIIFGCRQSDDILVLGGALIDFVDIDFDGVPELLVGSQGTSQRGGTKYYIYKLNQEANGNFKIWPIKSQTFIPRGKHKSFEITKEEPFINLDSFTWLNLRAKTLVNEEHNGACDHVTKVFKQITSPTTPFTYELETVRSGASINRGAQFVCAVSTFTLKKVNGQKMLKLTHEWVLN